MSYRKTWGELKEAAGSPVGLCGTNANLLPYANEAVESLWSEGDWIGKHQRYKIRVTSNCRGNRCITWPTQIEAIEAVSICNQPIGVRNQFFEFMSNAVGQLECSGLSLLGDRSETCVNHDISTEAKRLKIYTQRIESNQTVRLLGYDENGLWIRTQVSGVWEDGEILDLSASPATTTHYFSVGSPTGVQFSSDSRNGEVYFYSLDDDAQEIQLATYQYNELIPIFRRSILSGLRYTGEENQACQCVTILARMRFQAFKNDYDYVQIGNISALKSMIQYLWKRDNSKPDEAAYYRAEAVRLMNNELKQYNGYGAIKRINFPAGTVVGAGRNMF